MSRALLLCLSIAGMAWGATPAAAQSGQFTEPVAITAEQSAITVTGPQLAHARLQYFRIEAVGTTTIDYVTYRGQMGNGRVQFLATPPGRGGAFAIQDPDMVIESVGKLMADEGVKVAPGGETAEVEAGHARYPLRHFQLIRENRAPQNCFAFGVGVGRASRQFRGNTEQIFGFHCLRIGLQASNELLSEYFAGIVVHKLAGR